MQPIYVLFALVAVAAAQKPRDPNCLHQKACITKIGYCSDGKGNCRAPNVDANGEKWCDCAFGHIHCAPYLNWGCECKGGTVHCAAGSVDDHPDLPRLVLFQPRTLFPHRLTNVWGKWPEAPSAGTPHAGGGVRLSADALGPKLWSRRGVARPDLGFILRGAWS